MVNLRTFDLNLLRVFEAIMADNSVSKAADKLGMSQPAVSNALNRLRRELDDPLFVRTPIGMDPTPRAQDLAKAVADGLMPIRAGLSASANFDPATSTRRFRILMTDVGQISFLPALLKEVATVAPNTRIQVLESGRKVYADMLDSGLADLAVGRFTLPGSFESQLLHTSPFVVLMSSKSETALHDRVFSLDDYLEHKHILVQPLGASDDPIQAALGANARQRNIVLTIPHATALPGIIESTGFLATIPKVAADKIIAANPGGFIAKPAPFVIEPNLVYMWWHRRSHTDAGHIWLRDSLAAADV